MVQHPIHQEQRVVAVASTSRQMGEVLALRDDGHARCEHRSGRVVAAIRPTTGGAN